MLEISNMCKERGIPLKQFHQVMYKKCVVDANNGYISIVELRFMVYFGQFANTYIDISSMQLLPLSFLLYLQTDL